MNVPFRALSLLAAGFAAGVAASIGGYFYSNRSTTVYTTTAPLRSGDLSIPVGTQLVHHRAMSEGFDTLVLYVNVDGATRGTSLTRRVEDKAFLVIPYWVEKNARP